MKAVVFDNSELVPAKWLTPAVAESARVFNPALLRSGDGWLLAYRVVAAPDFERRIAMCRLGAEFEILPDSHVSVTDKIQFRDAEKVPVQVTTWFADPRLYRLENRLWLYWNSGWHEPQNHQFLQQLDPETLHPVGYPRELLLSGSRRKLEKNWTLFECDGIRAVYSINPHRILALSLDGTGPIHCRDADVSISNPGGFARKHGGLRGGAPPVRQGDHFYSFCHSIEDDPEGYRYVASVYRFSANPSFRPTDMPTAPLHLDFPTTARRKLPRLNPAVSDVVYPAGAACHDHHWVVSCGIDDERCAVFVFEENDVTKTLAPVLPVA